MKDSEVYLRAAEESHNLRYGLAGAVLICRLYEASPVKQRARDIFLDTFNCDDMHGNGDYFDCMETKDVTTLCLLFMHQIALDEERGTRKRSSQKGGRK